MRTAEEYAELAIDSLHKSTQGTHEFTMATLIQTAQVFAVLAQAAATRELCEKIEGLTCNSGFLGVEVLSK